MNNPTFAHRLLIRLGLVGAIALLLAACAGGGAQPVADPAEGGEAPVAGGDSDEQSRGGAEDDQEQPFANLVDRQIVKTGEATVEVSSVATAVGQVRAMALDLGGYVGGSRAGDEDEAASLTLRIPAERFDDAIAALHELDGDVVAEATREEDVTSSIVDLEARIRNLEASEAQYRALLDRATEIDDILTVQSRLDDVRGRIEQLQAQLEQLSGLASLATLTVTLSPVDAPIEERAAAWDAGAVLDSALAALVAVGQVLATAAIWLAIVVLPLLAAGGLVLLVATRAAPGLRRSSTGSGE